MTSPIDPYTHSGLLALKTIGLEGMNPTYNLGQKDADILKNVLSQALMDHMTQSDSIRFPEYESFKTTILSLTDRIYGKNSIGPLFKTLLDAMNVNSDGNLVLSTTNSKQLEKIDKLVADFEYQFESTYGAALFDTLGLGLSQKTNVAVNKVNSKLSRKANIRYNQKGVPKGVPIASPAAAGGAQVGGAKLANLTNEQKIELYTQLTEIITHMGPKMSNELLSLAGQLIFENNLEYNHARDRRLLPMLKLVGLNPTNMNASASASASPSRSTVHLSNTPRESSTALVHTRASAAAASAAYDDEKVDPIYAEYTRLKRTILNPALIAQFNNLYMEDIQERLLAYQTDQDFDPIQVANFLIRLAAVRARSNIQNKEVKRDAEEYIRNIQEKLKSRIPNFGEILAGTAAAGVGLYLGHGIMTVAMGAEHFVSPPGILAGLTPGLGYWDMAAQVISNLKYYNAITVSLMPFTTGGMQEMSVGIIRIVAGVCIALLILIVVLYYKKLRHTQELTYKAGSDEFDVAVGKLTTIITRGVQATTRFGVITAAAAASMALGLPPPVAISAAASALGSNGSAANGVVSLMQPIVRRGRLQALQQQLQQTQSAAASSSSSDQPGISRASHQGAPFNRSRLLDHTLGMAAANLAPGAAAAAADNGLTNEQRRQLAELLRIRRGGPGPGGARRKRTIRKIKHKKRHTKRHTRK